MASQLQTIQIAPLPCTASSHQQRNHKRHRQDRVNDRPHAHSPPPSRGIKHALSNIAAHPSVDNKRRSSNIRPKQARSQRADIRHDDFDQEGDDGEADLVDDRSRAESADGVRESFNDGSNHVESDRDVDEF